VLLVGFFGLLLLGGLAVVAWVNFAPQNGRGPWTTGITGGGAPTTDGTIRELNQRAWSRYYDQKDFAAAIADWTQSLTLDPRQPDLYSHLTFALCQTKQYDSCVRYAETCQQMATTGEVQAKCLRNMGRCQWLAGQQTAARATLVRALQLPDDEGGRKASLKLSQKFESGIGIPHCYQ